MDTPDRSENVLLFSSQNIISLQNGDAMCRWSLPAAQTSAGGNPAAFILRLLHSPSAAAAVAQPSEGQLSPGTSFLSMSRRSGGLNQTCGANDPNIPAQHHICLHYCPVNNQFKYPCEQAISWSSWMLLFFLRSPPRPCSPTPELVGGRPHNPQLCRQKHNSVQRRIQPAVAPS